jgi:hypothetical protein
VVDKGYLPAARAKSCPSEYGEVNFAYKKLIEPSVDAEVAKRVLDRAWMPDPHIRLFGGTVAAGGHRSAAGDRGPCQIKYQ